MKRISVFLAGLLIALSVHAYDNIAASAVTITVIGNKDLQISVDGRDYNLSNNSVAGNKTTLSLDNLATGQHTFQLLRSDLNTNRSGRINTTFNLRYGYDMLITINKNGSIELVEMKKVGISDNQAPMSNANYNALLRHVTNQRSVQARRNLVANAFNKTGNYFSTYQVSQLLQLINSESARLELAKTSYRTITDRGNFDQVYNLLNSTASKNELEYYVSNYNEDNYNYDDHNNSNVAMSDANFTTLLNTIRQQWPVGTQMTSLSNAFNNSNNYFTVYQASQLIQLVSGDNNRLQLAKISYRSITDPANFNQIYNLLSSQSSKDELANSIRTHTGNNTNAPMSDAGFSDLYRTIQEQRNVNTQLISLTNAFNGNGNFFTTYQIRQLILLSNTENNRLQLAKLSYKTVTDRNNFSDIYDLFSSQASKNELAGYVNNYTGVNSNPQMSDVNFTTLYQTIQGKYLPFEKMSYLTSAFNNTTYYFTSAQARQLIMLVSSETNRLQLAKLSYRTITDRDNFTQLYDVLSTQASRDELDAYAKAYNG